MKKRFLVAVAILTASVSVAQQKKQPPPPPAPPPPKVTMEKFLPPPPPPPKPKKAPIVKDEIEQVPRPVNADYQAFLKRNPTVKGIGWSENKVRIHLKSGKEEIFNRNDKEEMQKLQDKYGEPPAPPPPPPPPSPKISKKE